jgi:bifunctional DNase/RNase
VVKDEGRVEIEVKGGDFNLNRVRRKKNIARIEQLLAECFHQPMKVVIKGDSRNGRDRQSQKKNSELERQALTHPLVIEALDIFNGRVEKVNIKQEEDQ